MSGKVVGADKVGSQVTDEVGQQGAFPFAIGHDRLMPGDSGQFPAFAHMGKGVVQVFVRPDFVTAPKGLLQQRFEFK